MSRRYSRRPRHREDLLAGVVRKSMTTGTSLIVLASSITSCILSVRARSPTQPLLGPLHVVREVALR